MIHQLDCLNPLTHHKSITGELALRRLPLKLLFVVDITKQGTWYKFSRKHVYIYIYINLYPIILITYEYIRIYIYISMPESI